MTSLPELLAVLREKRVRLWEDKGDLRLSAPRDALTPELTGALRARKTELIDFLRGPRPLSFAQERLWFLEKLGGAGAAYNIAAAARIHGALDAGALGDAFERLQQRHEILRARFVEVDGEPQQLTRQETARLEVVDAAGLDLAQGVAAAEQVARQPFDLGAGRLLRAQLYRFNDHDHLLAVTLHHLISDGLSLDIFVRELVQLYQGRDLPAPPFQYADFVATQRTWLTAGGAADHVEYRRERLDEAPDAIQLPTDRPRPPRPSFRGATVPVVLPRDVGDAVHRCARDTGATPFMIMLAAYAALLSRSSMQDEVVVGIPIANRSMPGADRAMGLFVNALPIRVLCGRTDTGFALIERVREAVLAALSHAEAPWEFLLDALEPRRDLSRPPVFQVTFTLQDDPASSLALPGLTFVPIPLATASAKFELSLELQRAADGAIAGLLEYNGDLFDHETASDFANRYVRVVTQLAATPAAPLVSIDLSSDDERAAVARAWSGPTVDFTLARNIPEAFLAQVRRRHAHPAVVLRDRTWTFGDLAREAGHVAGALARDGSGSGQTVGVLVHRTFETIAAIVGVLLAGAAYVPIDPLWPEERRRQVVALAGCATTIDPQQPLEPAPPPGRAPEPDAHDAAYVLFTSGSTGAPKGVVVEHHSVLHLLAALEHAVYAPLGIPDTARVSVNGALTFDTSVKQIFQLLQGRTLVLIPDDLRLDGGALLAYAAATNLQVLDCTPSQLTLLADAGLGDAATDIGALLSGGEALTPALCSRLRGPRMPRIVNLYGPTECTVDATVHILDSGETLPVLGRPLPNMQVLVLDELQRPVPAGVPGELFIGGPGVARGYLGDEDLTRDRFIANPFPGVRSTRLYRTGDRGRLRPDGRLEYLGRTDHQIKLRGHRIELGEIERVLEQHPDVRAACVLVVGDDDSRRLAAVASITPAASPTFNGRTRYVLPNGLAIAQLNPNETDFLYQEMFERNAYLRHGLDVRDGDTVLDVGANIGMFALSMHVRRAALRIVCVEPNPHVREILEDNLRLFGADATVHDCGVGAEAGEAEFTFYPGFSILSGLHADAGADKAVVRSYIRRQTEGSDGAVEGVEEILEVKFQSVTLPVRLRPLGDIIDDSGLARIDLLKINVERAELDALLGIRDDQWDRIRQITLEVHDVDGRLHTVLALLRGKGFDVAVDEDWSLEHSAGTNYYLYAARPESVRDGESGASAADRIRQFARPFLTPADLREHLERRLPDYMTPSAIAIVDRLPLTSHGKVDRARLARLSWDSEAGDETMTAAERVVAEHWQRVLKGGAVGPRDHFFRAGGHSLSAVRLAAQLSTAFVVQVSVATIFEHPVLRDMTAAIQASVAAEPLPAIEPQAITDTAAVSYGQERLLFLEHLEGGGRAYVIAGTASLTGHLDVEALRAALRSTASRHTVLRSAYSLDTGAAVARICDELPELETLSADSESDAFDWMRRRAADPFDIANGPLLRAAVIRVGRDAHFLFVAFHHLIADGWSVSLFVRELAQGYRHHLGQGDAPAPLPIQYTDFARWQRTWLAGARLERGLAYWTTRLEGAPPFLAVPTDHPRPDINAYRGATIAFDLPPALRARIEAAARALDATPFMVLLGSFTTLLSRWTGQSDLVVGSPSAGRGHAGTEDLIGLFANLLALRVDVGGAATFRALIDEVRQATRDALAHEDVPFERLVEALRPPRLLNKHPVFQVLFALQNLPSERIDLPGLAWTPVPFDTPAGRFDLELVFAEEGDGYRGTLEYSEDLFDARTMTQLADWYARILTAVLDDADVNLATIRLADDVESASPEPNAPPEPFVPVTQMIAEHVRVQPSAPALSYRGRTLSYAEMHEQVRRCAAWLQRHDVRAGHVVAVCTDRSPVWVISALAALELGAVFLPVDPEYPRERIQWILEDAGATVEVRTEDQDTWLRDEAQPAVPRVTLAPTDPAYLIYTSGSTGQPKGALNTHGGLTNVSRNFVEIFETSPDSRVLHFASIGFDASIVELFMALAGGGCLCLADREQLLPGTPLTDTLVRERITHATLPPSVLAGMTETPFPELRFLTVAGEACPLDVIRRWAGGRRFFNNYGPTEAAVCATFAECHADDTRVTIGRPLGHVSVCVVDQAMRAVPPGIVGEICIGGAGVAIGYWQRPGLTAEKFVDADPYRSGRTERFYRSGDQGRLLADGSLEFLGRRDQQIKLHGYRIELGEIEAALRGHPSIRDCAVIMQDAADAHTRLVAFVVAARARPDDGGAATMKEFLRSRLPDYMVPSVFVDLDRLPLTAHGKLDRRALERWPVGVPRASAASPAPASDTAHAVAAIFAEVLGRPSFGTRDDFFEHGGHSLLAAQVMTRVRERLKTDLTLRTLFESPTPRALAARVDAAVADALPPLTSSARFAERAVLSPAQRRLWFLDRLDRSHAAYNVVAAARLRGRLDIAALSIAVRALSERHEVLRTRYPARNGEPVVELSDRAEELQVIDAGSWPRAMQLADEESRRPFDLADGPLFRPTLYRAAADEWLFVAAMHHIVSDGWSIGVLVSDLGALYEAAAAGSASPAAPAVQYGDYARWLDRALSGPLLTRQTAFWKTRLAGAPPQLTLPTDEARPAMQTFRGGVVRFDIPASTATALRAVARRHNATLFMTLLAAFSAWLRRYSGQQDLVVGTPVANRRVREIEQVAGLFANTLPLRMRVRDDETFAALLERVRTETLDAFAHADVPFDAIVEAAQPQRRLSHSPVFQVMFAQTSGLAGRLELRDVAFEPLSLDTGGSKFDLTLFVDDPAPPHGTISAVLEYNADLFHGDTAQRMAQGLARLLDALVESPESAVGDLPCLGAQDQLLLASWNDTGTQRHARTFFDLFEPQVRRAPDAIAVVDGTGREREISYGELDRRANRLARHLRAIGVGRETLAGIFLERSPDLLVALLAVWKTGGAYVPIDVQYPAARLAFMLEDAAVPIVVTTSALVERLPGSRARVVDLMREKDQLASLSESPLDHDVHPGDLAYMIYTSGSTGQPKGVLIEHGALANYLEWAAREYRMTGGSGAPVISSVSFDATITSLFGPLAAGQRVVLLPEGRELDALSSADFATADHTFYKITPSHLDGLNALTDPATLAGRVRELVIGGEALTSASLQPWSAHAPDVVITNEYGPTETVVGCAIYRAAARDVPDGAIPIGRPIANTVIHLLDERRQLVPVGAVGEIYIGGDGVARGYYNRPELTAERFVELRIGDGAPSRFYRTGDLARWNRQGALIFLGRRDGQVKLRGHRIELGEIDAAARGFAGVAHAAATLQGATPADARLALYVVAEHGSTIDIEALGRHLQSVLPVAARPSLVQELEALPLTPHGKIDRDALAQRRDDAPTAIDTSGSGDHVRDLVAGVWTSLLGAAPDAPGADFFAAGGHSLLAARLTAGIRDVAGVDLSLQTVLEHPTWQGLADAVSRGRRASDPRPPIAPSGQPPVLSFGQHRLWAIEQLDSPGAAYHVPSAFRLRGPLDAGALERALDAVAGRHEVLRSCFPSRDGRPELTVRDRLDPMVRETVTEPELDDRLLELASRPFDLEHGPLVRAAILRLTDEDHIFLVVMHHLVSDGWSSTILARELELHYAGRPPLPALPFQYADYAAWQRDVLSGEALERLSTYWTETLRGAPPAIELPGSAARPTTQSYRGAVLEFRLDAGQRERLSALSRREGVTLFMTLLAAYATVLSRWSGQDDLVIGTPMANRPAGTESLVGFFVNTLPLRLRLPDGLTLRELLTQVRTATLGALDQQELPFDRLVELANPPRNPSVSPIFQTLFTYQADPGSLTLPGIAVEPVRVPHVSAKFDVTMAIDESPSGLDGCIEYADSLFDEHTISGVRDRFVAVLDAMLNDVETAIDAVPMLTPVDAQLLEAWNGTAHEYAEPRLIHQMIEDQARRAPDRVALIFEGQTLTYGELDERATRLAHALRARGVGADVAVGVSLERSIELPVAILGILKAGGAYVPLDPEYPAERLAGMRADAGLRVVIDEHSEIWSAAAAVSSVPNGSAADLAYIIFTSGSTGRPKGVMIEHGAIRNRLLWMQDAYQLTPADVVMQKTPVSFDVSVWELFWPLMYGARLVLARPRGHRDGAYLTRLIAEQQVTTMHFVPSMMQAFLEQPGIEALTSLRQVFCSGEALPWAVVHKFEQRVGCPLHNLYGPTEAAVDVTSWRCRSDVPGRSVPIGKPIANTQIHILDARLRPAPVGVAGELFIGGINLARGYVGRPDLTAERFVDVGGRRLYRTGDRARWRADGEIEYLGRLDAQVKLRGFRIELGEIESALMQHPGVAEAAAALVGDHHPRLVGYIVARGGMPDAATLRGHLADRLPEYMIPSAFVELERLPLGATGKLDRGALPAPAIDARASIDAPETPAERVLAAIWEDVLGIPGIGRDQNFFELGGDSILAIQMAARAGRAGLRVSPRLLLEHQTLAGLCAAAAAARPIDAEQGVLDGEMPATPMLDWFANLALANPNHFNQGIVLSTSPALDAATLEQAVRLLVEQHDTLRLRWDGRRSLRYGPVEGSYTFETVTGAPLEGIAARMQTSLDPVSGPLSRIVYAPDCRRFVWIAHHLAVDAVSWDILVDDLDRICRLLTSARPPALPPKTTSLRQWARAVSGMTATPSGGLAPSQRRLLDALRSAWRVVLGDEHVAVDIEGHGRTSPSDAIDVSRTVGWFTSITREGSGAPRALFNYLGVAARHDEEGAMFGPAGDDIGAMSDPRNTLPYAVEVVMSTDGRDSGTLAMRFTSPDRTVDGPTLKRLEAAMRASLAAVPLADRSPVAQASRNGESPLVRIRHVPNDESPLFLVHPGGGTVLCYRELAARLDFTTYGLQAPGLAEGESAVESVEALATRYLDAIMAAQPSGAYRIGGWSFGGVVAFEMARQMRALGRDVAQLIVLDVHAPGAIADEVWDRDAANLLVDIFAEDLGVRHDDLRGRSIDEQLAWITRRAIASGMFPQGFTEAMARRAWDVFQTHRRAERRYQGGPFDGELLLVTSDSRLQEADPTLGWSRFVERIVRHAVPGNHQQMLRAPAVDALAGCLGSRLRT